MLRRPKEFVCAVASFVPRSLPEVEIFSRGNFVVTQMKSDCISKRDNNTYLLRSFSSITAKGPRIIEDRQHEALTRMPKELPHFEFSSNKYELERHGRGWFGVSQPPALVVYCKSTSEVQEVVQYCIRNQVPMIPFGAGTSVEGHLAAVRPNTLSIDLAKHMNSIHAIPNMVYSEDEEESHSDAYAIVDAGVTRLQLQQALKSTGFTFPVDPGADATIGGMVSTGASGTTTVKYGSMKDNLLELTAVLATTEDAPIIHTGSKALKNVAGYDLTSLLCGSEGTLGIVTRATLRLHPVPQHTVAMSCSFATLHDAAEAVQILINCGVDLQRCELLDQASMRCFAASTGSENAKDLKPTLFLELSAATQSALREQINVAEEILESDRANVECQVAENEQDRLELWKARHNLVYASINSRPGAERAMVTDACVPLSHLADLIVQTSQDVETEGVVGPIFGHSADGNMHCILPILPDESPEYWEKLQRIQAKLIERTLAVGGTCTGEHGIGVSKQGFLQQQYNQNTMETMKLIKRAMDPHNLLNPNKVLTLDEPKTE